MIALLLTALYFLLFNFIIYRFKAFQLQGFKPWVSNALFNIKFVAGLFIWAIYTFYYIDKATSDVHKFYADAGVIYSALPDNAPVYFELLTGYGNSEATVGYKGRMKNWERNFDEAPVNENRTIIRLNALLMLFSFNTYFVHILAMCFISLFGWVLLFNSVFNYLNRAPSLLALLPLLLPSVLFWASGVLKEPILILGLGVFIHGMLAKHYRVKILGVGLGVVILLSIKFYVLVCLLPATFAFFLLPKQQHAFAVTAKYIAVNISLLIAAFNIQHIAPGINAMQMLANKQHHSIKEAIYFNAGSRIEIPAIAANATSIISAAPVAIWNTLSRPYVWEGKNPMMLASALENLMMLFIVTLSLVLYNRRNTKQLNIIFFLIISSLTYFALIGICTPVLGNLVRYKAPLLPLLLFGFIALANEQKLIAKVPILNRLRL